MPLSIKQGGVWKEAEVHVKHGGVWKRAEVWVKQSGVWKQAASTEPVVHTISPSTQSKSGRTANNLFPFTSVVTGGTPTSYSWGILSSSLGNFSVSSTTANATVNVNSVVVNTTANATIYCDVVVNGVTYRATATCSHTRTP